MKVSRHKILHGVDNYDEEVMHMKGTIVVDNALIEQLKPMIYTIIKKEVSGYQTSDVCFEFEDLYQECLIHLMNAARLYDTSLGTKFSTFAHFHLSCRMGNFRNKIKKKNYKTKSFTDIKGGWNIMGCEGTEDDGVGLSKVMRGHVSTDTQEFMAEIADCKALYDKLKGDRKIIYREMFLLGKSVKEICTEYEHLEYYQIRKAVKHLEKIHETLVKGKVCLQ